MDFTKITEEDLLNKGVFGLPDTPDLSTQDMQEKFDEISKDVIIPKINALIDELETIKSIEKVADSVEDSDTSIPTGKAVAQFVVGRTNELAKKPVYKSAGGFPSVGDIFTIYIDDTVSPRLLYTWDEKNGYVLTGGAGGGGGEPSSDGVVLLEITSAVYEALPNNEKMRDDVQYFISDKSIIKYKDKSYGGNGGEVDIDYSELEFDTEEIVVENPMEDDIPVVADEYSAAITYEVGDYCIRDNALYKCTGATSGAWDASKWTATTIGSELDAVNDKIGNDFAYLGRYQIPGNGSKTLTVGFGSYLLVTRQGGSLSLNGLAFICITGYSSGTFAEKIVGGGSFKDSVTFNFNSSYSDLIVNNSHVGGFDVILYRLGKH